MRAARPGRARGAEEARGHRGVQERGHREAVEALEIGEVVVGGVEELDAWRDRRTAARAASEVGSASGSTRCARPPSKAICTRQSLPGIVMQAVGLGVDRHVRGAREGAASARAPPGCGPRGAGRHRRLGYTRRRGDRVQTAGSGGGGMKISGSTTVITGGASGLGRATAERLAAAAARVVLLDLAKSPGADVAAELGERAVFAPADVTSADEVAAALEAAVGALRRGPRPRQLRGHRHRGEDLRQARARPTSPGSPASSRSTSSALQLHPARRRADGEERAQRGGRARRGRSTPPRWPRSTARSARPPTPPRRAASWA